MVYRLGLCAVVMVSGCAAPAAPRVLVVGPGHPYPTPCAAIAAARPGDQIEIDARGNARYRGDVCAWSIDRLTIVGVHGRAHIDAAGRAAEAKAIWVIAGDDTKISNVELSGARVPDRNGAGIRQEGANLAVSHSFFHDNEDGILTGANPRSAVVITSSRFSANGAGDGYSHNIYVGAIRSFTLRYSVSSDARLGDLVKSRAATNLILYNRLAGGRGSDTYELDLPNGGLAYVIGNVLQQGRAARNPNLLAIGEEGAVPGSRLFAVANTFVNDLGRGTAIFVGSGVSTSVTARDNLSTGSPIFVTQLAARLAGNCLTNHPRFAAAGRGDYHLTRRSPCVDLGAAPGRGAGRSLTPTQQYVEPLRHTHRRVHGGHIDPGAFELAPAGR